MEEVSALKPTPAPGFAGCQPCTLASAKDELRVSFLGTSLTRGAGVVTHPHCHTVFADTVAIEGGGTQEALGSRGLMGSGALQTGDTSGIIWF